MTLQVIPSISRIQGGLDQCRSLPLPGDQQYMHICILYSHKGICTNMWTQKELLQTVPLPPSSKLDPYLNEERPSGLLNTYKASDSAIISLFPFLLIYYL